MPIRTPDLPAALRLTSTFPFVGRATELETLRTLMPRAESEGRRVVLLGGEPGSGKSRLVREFAGEAAADGALGRSSRRSTTWHELPTRPSSARRSGRERSLRLKRERRQSLASTTRKLFSESTHDCARDRAVATVALEIGECGCSIGDTAVARTSHRCERRRSQPVHPELRCHAPDPMSDLRRVALVQGKRDKAACGDQTTRSVTQLQRMLS